MNPGYFAIIPATVRYDENLTANAKLMFGEISALTNKEGYCFADNSYFMRLYGASERSVSRWVSQLRENGHIEIFIDHKAGNKRKITIDKNGHRSSQNCLGVTPKLSTPIDKNGVPNKRNNSIINNISMCEDHTQFAFDFLKKQFPSLHESMIMQFKSKIKDWERFIIQFNAVCEKEEINFSSRAITGRFTLYANNWIKNEKRSSQDPQKQSTPAFLSNAF